MASRSGLPSSASATCPHAHRASARTAHNSPPPAPHARTCVVHAPLGRRAPLPPPPLFSSIASFALFCSTCASSCASCALSARRGVCYHADAANYEMMILCASLRPRAISRAASLRQRWPPAQSSTARVTVHEHAATYGSASRGNRILPPKVPMCPPSGGMNNILTAAFES